MSDVETLRLAMRDMVTELDSLTSQRDAIAAERNAALAREASLVAELEACRSDLVGLRAKIEALADEYAMSPQIQGDSLTSRSLVAQRLRALLESP